MFSLGERTAPGGSAHLRSTISFVGRETTALLSRMLPALPEAMAGRVRMEQVQSILRMTPVMMGANIIIAILVAFAGQGSPHTDGLTLWACAVVAYALLGLRGWVASQRRRSPNKAVSARGVRRITWQAGVLGSLWAILPILTMPAEQGFKGSMPMMVASVIAGMIGCGGFAPPPLPAAAMAYSTPMPLGALLGLSTRHDPILFALGGLLIFCHAVVVVSCLSHAKIFVDRLVAAEELETQRQVVSLLLSDFEEGASDWLWEVDALGRLTYVSDRMVAAAGVERARLLGQPMSDLCGA